jgi:hypothetical protein
MQGYFSVAQSDGLAASVRTMECRGLFMPLSACNAFGKMPTNIISYCICCWRLHHKSTSHSISLLCYKEDGSYYYLFSFIVVHNILLSPAWLLIFIFCILIYHSVDLECHIKKCWVDIIIQSGLLLSVLIFSIMVYFLFSLSCDMRIYSHVGLFIFVYSICTKYRRYKQGLEYLIIWVRP